MTSQVACVGAAKERGKGTKLLGSAKTTRRNRRAHTKRLQDDDENDSKDREQRRGRVQIAERERAKDQEIVRPGVDKR